jgi:hypothetical protein
MVGRKVSLSLLSHLALQENSFEKDLFPLLPSKRSFDDLTGER